MIWKVAQQLQDEGFCFVVVTMTHVRGSAPQNLGAKAIVSERGLEAGTVGGGKVEAACIEKAFEILKNDLGQAPQSVTWNLQKDIGMTCGGEATFLFEHFPGKNWPIAIFGAGHVGQALSRVLSKLKCQLTVIDERSEWLEKLEGVKTLCPNKLEDAVSVFNEKTYFICMSKGHASDVPVLAQIAKLFPGTPYVGAIGSTAKANVIIKDLQELGVSEEFIQKVRIPIGLPIGSNDPEEIAISIAAQLLEIKSCT